jgi:hypothetical protein
MITDYSEAIVQLKPTIHELEKSLQREEYIAASMMNNLILAHSEDLRVWIESKVKEGK